MTIEKTKILNQLETANILGSDRFVVLVRPFVFWSRVLNRACRIPVNFVFDLESIPWFRGACPEAGAAHDYLCRTDSEPVVGKSTAAKVYLELLDYTYSLDDNRVKMKAIEKLWDAMKAHAKYWAVSVAPGYFHKHPVAATYEEMSE